MQTSKNCCPLCNLYNKYPGFDYCCRTCNKTNGQNHGQSCQRIICSKKLGLNQSHNQQKSCCSLCNLYNKYPGFNYCCRTCHKTNGQNHGQSCQRIKCNKYQNQNINQNINQNKNQTNCSNLYNGSTTICFYKSSQPYYEFTNFYPAPITIDNKTYSTSEHYFQSQKFASTNNTIAENIRHTLTPREAFDIANDQQNKQFIRSDWHSGYKDKAMKQALKAKFTQHANLKQLLLNTNTKKLVEHTTNDNYWGDNGDGTGQNKLGQFLMEIRDKLKRGILRRENLYYDKYIKYKMKYLDLKDELDATDFESP